MCAAGGGHRAAQRPRLIAGGGIVTGDRRGPLQLAIVVGAALLLQVSGQGDVQLAALARQQVVVQRLTQQRMAEAEPLAVAGDQHLLADGLPQRRLQAVALQPADRGQRRLVGGAGHRDRARHPLSVLAQTLDPHQEGIAQALGSGSPAVQPGGQQLLGVQRVALAAREQPLQHPHLGRRAQDVGQRLAELVAIERRQLDPVGPLQALELGQQRAQRMAAMQLVAAVGQHQAHPLPAQTPRQEGREGPGGPVGPVHVLQDQHHRGLLAQAVDELQQRFEQPQLIPRAGRRGARIRLVVEPGQDRGQLGPARRAQAVQRRVARAHQRPEGAEQRRVRQLAVALLHRVAAEEQRRRPAVAADAHPGQPMLELGDQAGLADPGVTAEQDEAGTAGCRLPDGEL